jgi:hypothetical protein
MPGGRAAASAARPVDQVATIFAASAVCPVCRHKAIPLWLLVTTDGDRTGCCNCLSHYTAIGGSMTFEPATRDAQAVDRGLGV